MSYKPLYFSQTGNICITLLVRLVVLNDYLFSCIDTILISLVCLVFKDDRAVQFEHFPI